MTAKEYLSQVKILRVRMVTLSEQLDYLKSAALYPSLPMSTIPKGPTRNIHKHEDACIRIMEKERQIEAVQNELLEISRAIESIGDTTVQAVVSKRYLSGKAWRDISCELSFSVPRLYELHREGLEEIEVYLKDHSKT